MFLAGCSATTFHSVPIEREKLNLKDPAPAVIAPMDFETLNNCSKDSQLGMSVQTYKNMILNFNALKDYITLQKSILDKYRDYYEK